MVKQRAKLTWLKDGDVCFKTFFKKVKARRALHRVYQIQSEQGGLLLEQDAIKLEFIKFFKNLLGGNNIQEEVRVEHISTWANHLITEEEETGRIAPIQNKEIRQVVFGIVDEKTPGPDGYSTKFYEPAWLVIGLEVSAAVREFFDNEEC
ncbi:UNVERIFIED_CONTAM: hypothetical protein Sradi_1583100 [Sesamum radiatum]|uniref:Reverse transcriptase domain-containing protein n=1 Tax=Sesamum radiatum TaxID=300843 RepID=A0AAW2U9A8_SESRA